MSGAVVHRKLRFGPFELSIGERVLLRDGQVLPLGGRALDILTYLADRPGEVIAKQELIDHVWSEHQGAWLLVRRHRRPSRRQYEEQERQVPTPRQAPRAAAHDDWARNGGRRG